MEDISAELVVLETIYYRGIHVDPIGLDYRWSYKLKSIEEPYIRQLTIDKKWKSLDMGWNKHCSGEIVISNTEGNNLTVNPTEGQREGIAGRILQITAISNDNLVNGGLVCLLHPGRHFRFYPDLESENLGIRLIDMADVDSIKCTLAVFPA